MELTVRETSGLGGLFSGFCSSNGIANTLNKRADGVWAQHAEHKKKLEALKNGSQAAEWESLKKEVRRLAEVLEAEERNLEQERAIAAAIGLGFLCKKAISRRKQAQAALDAANKALGEVKGAFQTLQVQQTTGIKEASKVIVENQAKIDTMRAKVAETKAKIAAYKAERDNEKQAQANATQEEVSAIKKSNIMGKVKDNAPLIIAGVAVIGAIAYAKRNKKKTTRKKVVA